MKLFLKNSKATILTGSLCFLSSLGLGLWLEHHINTDSSIVANFSSEASDEKNAVEPENVPKVVAPPTPTRTEELVVKSGTTMYSLLSKNGFGGKTIHDVVKVATPHADLSMLSVGTKIVLNWYEKDHETPSEIRIKLSPTKMLILTHHLADSQKSSHGLLTDTAYASEAAAESAPAQFDEWQANVNEAEITTRRLAFSGIVSSNLWNSASLAGMDPLLISKMSEVFAWQIDFNRDVQINDRWRIVVEQEFVEDEPIGWGALIAAQFENSGQLYTAVRHEYENGRVEYYDEDGDSLRRMFLKSPLKYGRITSGFNANRFHPILKIRRPHLGIDYGAPTGTPVMAVGKGKVTYAAYRGASGNMVSIRHNSVYKTAYKHLSRFAKGIKPGANVETGDIIGYVGSTGLSTGPHLHFEFYVNNSVVNPQKMQFPAADPVSKGDQPAYAANAEKVLAQLPPWSTAVLSKGESESERTR